MTQAQNLANWSENFADWSNPLSNRNYVVEGAFDYWTADSMALPVSGGYMNAPVHLAQCGAGGAGTLQRVDNRLIGIGDSCPMNYAAFAQTTASTGTIAANTAPYMLTFIEGVNRFAGRSITFSCKLWVGSGSITIPMIACRQNFGSGGSPSPQGNSDKVVNWVLTSTPQRFSVRIDVPNIVGKTIGTNNNDNLSIGFWLPPGVTFNLGTVEWQVEMSSPNSSGDINGNGGAPTPFEYRGRQAELARLYRLYETGDIRSAYWIFNNTNSFLAYIQAITFMVTKRAQPTVAFNNVAYYSGGTPTVMPVGNISLANASQQGCSIYLTGGMTSCQGIASGYWVADARM